MAPNLAYWPEFYNAPGLALERHPIFKAGTPIFTMGSCFADELRSAFREKKYRVLPDYGGVVFNPETVMFDSVPFQRDCIPHYDTFVMRQEFEAALGLWTDRSRGFWKLSDLKVNEALRSSVVWQDPYRKQNYGLNYEALSDLAEGVTAKIREGIAEAPVLVITLGLTEVWQYTATGRYTCRPPGTAGGGGKGVTTFHQSTFQENYDNVRAIADMVLERYPDKKIVISVSPVPLEKTFSGRDIGSANMESKSILRAVAGQICREYAGRLFYFPSYDAAMALRLSNVFEADGRHVTKAFASTMVELFMQFYSAD